MNKNVLFALLMLVGFAASLSAQPYYLRGSASPCDWAGNFTPTCQLTDPDADGVFTLTVPYGAAPIGVQEFKIYNQTADSWWPGGANAWYDHKGGSVTYRFTPATNLVEVVDGNQTVCAPGNWVTPNWTNTTPATNVVGNTWCFTVPTPGSYEWKPTLCGTWNSWQQLSGERSTNSNNWVFTTTAPNEQICVEYDPTTGRMISTSPPPTGCYLRGSGPLCGWNNLSRTCQLKDDDGDGVFDLTIDLGAAAGFHEFKVYCADNDTWYPNGANAWYNHLGGSITFKYYSGSGEVEVIDGYNLPVCAPGEFSGWDNTFPMMAFGDNQYCITIPNAGTYQWKPVVCGTFNSWQPVGGTRSIGSDNWTFTTQAPNQQICVTYDPSTGRMRAGGVNVPTMTEWGLFLFALLMSILGVVTIRQRKLAMAGTASSSFNLRSLPFNKSAFAKAFLGTALVIWAIFAAAMAFGYELTQADIPGSMLAIPMIAYLVTLLKSEDK